MYYYNIGSLFAGVGGICLGFKRASEKFRLVLANEIDENALTTYRYNFNHLIIKGDIEKILNPDIFYEERNFLYKKFIELENEEKEEFGIISESFYKKIFLEMKKEYLAKVYANGNINDFIPRESIFKYIKIKNKNNVIKKLEYDIVKELKEDTKEEKILESREKYADKRKKMLFNHIDILTAGFPCQAFSIAGERKGFDDHRGNLFCSIIDYVKQLDIAGHGKPRILFLENVKNLISHDNGRTFTKIKSELENIGYKLKYKVLNTCEYTHLPQNRERIFIICFLKEKDYNEFSFEKLKRYTNKSKETLRKEIDLCLDLNQDIKNIDYFYTAEKYPSYYNDKINLNKEINEEYEFYQLRRGMYVRKNQSGICPTLTANMGTGGHNVPLIKEKTGIRKLSPEECFNLQGFRVKQGLYNLPKISRSYLYKQAGNAVSVDVVQMIAEEIYRVLELNN